MKYLNNRQLEKYKQRAVNESYKYGATQCSRMFGVHRSTIYEWRKDCSTKKKGPKKTVPWQTSGRISRIVVKLRKQTNYGPKRLKVVLSANGIKIGEKAIRGIIERRRLVRKHRKKRKKITRKFFAPYPGYRIQIDTKTIPDNRSDKRKKGRYQFTAIDIATKIRFLCVYDELSNHNSILFVKQVIKFFQDDLGIKIKQIQSDNHMTFTNLYNGGNKRKDHQSLRLHPFTKYLLSQNIHHILSRPGTPTDNAFVERSHRTDMEEFYRHQNIKFLSNSLLSELNQALKKWTFFYNNFRPHSSCNNLPPLLYFFQLKTVGQTGA